MVMISPVIQILFENEDTISSQILTMLAIYIPVDKMFYTASTDFANIGLLKRVV